MFELAWPWVFLLAPLPWLLRALLPPADSGEAALRVTFLNDLAELSGQQARLAMPGWRAQVPGAALWLLLLCAAARPQWLGEPLPQPASGRDLLLAVDVSGSMEVPDMRWQEQPVTRLELVQHLFGDFVEARHGDRIGLILFGSQAYLQSPLTFDRRTVRVWLDEARVGIAGNNTALGDAIGLAIKRLRERPAEHRVLILVTDGANNGGEIDPRVAADLAASQGIRVHTVGMGADPGQSALGNLFGFTTGLELDEPTLRAIAERTGGRYFRARSREELAAVGRELDRLEPVAQLPVRTHQAEPLHVWPLAAALLGSLALAGHALWPALRQRLHPRREPDA